MTRPVAPLTLALALAGLAALAALPGCKKDITCPLGEVACGGRCVDLSSDAAACGACGHACDARATCQAGACACAPGLAACGDACVELASDPAHCGACGTACSGATPFCATPSGGATTCVAACGPGPLSACGHACVDLVSDRFNCGACGHACQAGESCTAGGCRSVAVACFATDDVRAVSPDLSSRAAPRQAGDGPIALAPDGATTWAAASLSGSLVRLPALPAGGTEYLIRGNDFEYVTVAAGKVLLANAGAGSVVVFDPAANAVVDEVVLGATALVNPKGIAWVPGTPPKLYVSLYGDSATGDPAVGQTVAVLDATGLAACGLAVGPGHCLRRTGTLDMAGGAETDGRPFPGRSVVAGGKVWVTVANLKLGAFGFFTDPAGPGRLAVIDPADDSVTFLSLGAGCGNPGGVAVRGSTVWVACGAFAAAGLVEVDAAATPPTASEVHPVPIGAPGNVAFCGTRGFVTDQFSGDVYPFDPVTFANSPAAATTVCPVSAGQFGFAWAADVSCAGGP